jgi:hypothetical protein
MFDKSTNSMRPLFGLKSDQLLRVLIEAPVTKRHYPDALTMSGFGRVVFVDGSQRRFA